MKYTRTIGFQWRAWYPPNEGMKWAERGFMRRQSGGTPHSTTVAERLRKAARKGTFFLSFTVLPRAPLNRMSRKPVSTDEPR